MKKNIAIKVVVLIVAIILWLHFTLVRTHEQGYEVPIALTALDSGFVVLNEDELYVPVTIKAKGIDLLALKFSESQCIISADNYEPGENPVYVSHENFFFPERLNIELRRVHDIKDKSIVIDESITKLIPVSIEYASAEDEEYFVNNTMADVRIDIEVSGPATIINEIDHIRTKPASKDLFHDGTASIELIKPHPKVDFSRNHINIDIVETKIVNRTISLIPIDFPHHLDIAILPQKVSLLISGPADIVNDLSINDIKAEVLEKEIIDKEYAEIHFELPAGVKLLEYTPKRIQILRNE
jgi:hypothetical protein